MSSQNRITLNQFKSHLNFENIDGWAAQKEMAPPPRLKMDLSKIDISDARIAAVLFLIYQENNQLKFPVILRNKYPGVHSNQIGLPGGKVEPIDKTLAETAIRECQEEIGAVPESIELQGQLSPLYIPPSNFMVHPFVGIYNKKPEFIPCDFEVQKIYHIGLDELVIREPNKAVMTNSTGISMEVPTFTLSANVTIWGATAMIINEFRVLVKKSLNL